MPTVPANVAAAGYLNFVNYAYAMYESDPNSLTPLPPANFPANYTMIAYLSAFDPWADQRVFYGFLAAPKSGSQSVVLAVRGTDSLPEWGNDFDIYPVDFTVPDTLVAGGFFNVWSSLEWNRPSGESADIKSIARELALGLVLVGHSLGAAIVTMIALDWWSGPTPPKFPFTIYTAASPAVGCCSFAQAFNQTVPNSSRYINVADVVASGLDLIYTQINDWGLELGSFEIDPTLYCEHSLETYLWLIDSVNDSLPSDCQGLDAARLANFAKVMNKRRAALGRPPVA